MKWNIVAIFKTSHIFRRVIVRLVAQISIFFRPQWVIRYIDAVRVQPSADLRPPLQYPTRCIRSTIRGVISSIISPQKLTIARMLKKNKLSLVEN